jgi:hypothetical protein
VSHDQNYAPSTWYAEWLMEERRFPDTCVFVPALRRSLRLANTGRCSPVFGFGWSYDDAKNQRFQRQHLDLYRRLPGRPQDPDTGAFQQEGAIFPDGYLMPLGFPKPSWGKREVREHAIADIHRIPSKAAGYCYSSRIIYADKGGNVPGLGEASDGVSSMAMDFQNQHETVWSGFGNPANKKPYLNTNVPKKYVDGVKFGSRPGLIQLRADCMPVAQVTRRGLPQAHSPL